MRTFFLSIFLLFPLLIHCEEEIIVTLQTEDQLIPISLTKFQGDNSAYSKELEEVLKFDLNNNGMTTLTDDGLYRIAVSIKNKQLSATLSGDDGDFVREVKGIKLSEKIYYMKIFML